LEKKRPVQVVQAARVHVASVAHRNQAAPDIVALDLIAPELAALTRPGQYVMAIPPLDDAAAVALGVHDAREGGIRLLFFVTGPRTKALSLLAGGDALSLFGPLGNGFSLESLHDVAIVAGGVGIASVLLAARELRANGARVRLFYGARTVQRLVEREPFVRAGCEIVVATEDGSEGTRGFVTDALQASAMPQQILACGPTAMLRAVAAIAREWNVPAQLALEETFGCGVGACWGCVVPVAQNARAAPAFPPMSDGVVYARVCREGPIFSAEDLRW
jgi:dihydroorotate dehydrogenase electron transfer subunit